MSGRPVARPAHGATPAGVEACDTVEDSCDEGVASGTLVLVRHGRTAWNDANFMTGWANPALSATGVREARSLGGRLRRAGVLPTHVVTSRSDRAIETAGVIVEELDVALDVRTSWYWNERHLGMLQGLDRAAACLIYGRERVREWKRRRDATPPHLPLGDPRHPRHDARYRDVDPRALPGAESVAAMAERLATGWRRDVEPLVEGGATVMVVGHCHSLRELVATLAVTPSCANASFARPGDSIILRRHGDAWTVVEEDPRRARHVARSFNDGPCPILATDRD